MKVLSYNKETEQNGEYRVSAIHHVKPEAGYPTHTVEVEEMPEKKDGHTRTLWVEPAENPENSEGPVNAANIRSEYEEITENE